MKKKKSKKNSNKYEEKIKSDESKYEKLLIDKIKYID